MVGPNRPTAPIAGRIDLSKSTKKNYKRFHTSIKRAWLAIVEMTHPLSGAHRERVEIDTPIDASMRDYELWTRNVRAWENSRAVSLFYVEPWKTLKTEIIHTELRFPLQRVDSRVPKGPRNRKWINLPIKLNRRRRKNSF